MDGAGTALGDSATELHPGDPQEITEHPEERHVGRRLDLALLSIDLELHPTLPSAGSSGDCTPALRRASGGSSAKVLQACFSTCFPWCPTGSGIQSTALLHGPAPATFAAGAV